MSDQKQLGLIFLAIFGIAVFLAIRIFSNDSNNLSPEFFFFDVGQGDSELIEIQEGNRKIQILIDGGPGSQVITALSRALPIDDRYLDLVIMTHPQADHFGGLLDVLDKYEVGAFITPGRRGEAKTYEFLVKKLKSEAIPVITVGEGDKITIGKNSLKILAPSKSELVSREVNDASIVLLVETKAVSALFTGDIGAREELRLVERYDLSADLLKIPHHGSRFSSSEKFIQSVNPKLAIFEVGKNSYGHPAAVVTDRLKSFGALFLTTKDAGNIRVWLENDRLKAEAF